MLNFSRTDIIIFSIIIAVVLAIFIPGYSKLQKLKSENQGLTEQIERLTIENTKLAKEATKLEKDPLHIEGVAREKMGMSKKGELIYKIEE
ncbi:MAG: septum formation initiator family protein [Candidatus Omnitrophota bacterium]